MERVQCPLENVLLQTPIKALELSFVGGLRITATYLEFSPVLTKLTFTHIHTRTCTHARAHIPLHSDCPEARSTPAPSAHTFFQAGLRRLQKYLAMTKSFGIRAI